MYEMHMATHIAPYFRKLENMTELGITDYIGHRLQHVKAKTARKELSTIRQFMAWCYHPAKVLPERVFVPPMPKGAVGVAVDSVRQVKVVMTREQVDRLLAKVPERGRGGFPTLAYVLVMAETGLRRASMWRLTAPVHYHRGASHLTITPEMNKARKTSVLPLSLRAREALDAVCPESGPIFGRRDVREALKRASTGIGLPPHLEGRVSTHDLRHSFATDLLNRGASLIGVQGLMLHSHISSTAPYAHTTLAAAEAALAVRNGSNGTPIGTPKRRRAKKKKGAKRAGS